jgi:hypothetical protein
MKSPVYGTCCLCGSFGKLSFEHSPLSKAFNDDSVLYSEIQDWLAGGNPDAFAGKPTSVEWALTPCASLATATQAAGMATPM